MFHGREKNPHNSVVEYKVYYISRLHYPCQLD